MQPSDAPMTAKYFRKLSAVTRGLSDQVNHCASIITTVAMAISFTCDRETENPANAVLQGPCCRAAA